jgi:hypothetical protein
MPAPHPSLKELFIAGQTVQFIDTGWSHIAVLQAMSTEFVVCQEQAKGGSGYAGVTQIAGPYDELDDASNAMYHAAYCDHNFDFDKSTG